MTQARHLRKVCWRKKTRAFGIFISSLFAGFLFARVVPRDEFERKAVLSIEECPEPYDTRCCVKQSACPTLKKYNTSKYSTLSLQETFDYLRAGGSLSRFGDGEARAMTGGHIVFEKTSRELMKALNFVATLGGSPELSPCLCVGTYPLLDGNFSRFREGGRRNFALKNHAAYMESWNKHMPPGKYCDSFVSRADGVIEHEFPALGFFTPNWQHIFKGQRVLLVRGGRQDNSPTTADATVFDRHLKLARRVTRLMMFDSIDGSQISFVDSGSNVFKDYVSLRNGIVRKMQTGEFDVVVLSLGATATVLAAELSCRGYRAIDVGQFGGNFSKS